MSHNLTVEVLDSDGDPVSGEDVMIAISGVISGGTMEETTDSDGIAEFEAAQDYEDTRELHIIVQNQKFGPYEIEGGSYTVTLD